MKNQICIQNFGGSETAEIEIREKGKAKLVPGTENGSKKLIGKCIANYNRGMMYYVTSAGDEIPFFVR